jgi:hypothetical protein
MFSKECRLHLEEAKMSRWAHFKFAIGVMFQLKLAAGALFIHAFAPRYFKTYASDKIKMLNSKIEQSDK